MSPVWRVRQKSQKSRRKARPVAVVEEEQNESGRRRWRRGGGDGGGDWGRERVGESSQEPSREGREWRKSVVVSHVRSSDGDVLGIATRENERRRNLANPLEFSPPPRVIPRSSGTSSPTTAEPPAASARAPPTISPAPSQPHCEDQTHAPYLSSRCISVQHLPGELVALLHYARDVSSSRSDPRPNESPALVLHVSFTAALTDPTTRSLTWQGLLYAARYRRSRTRHYDLVTESYRKRENAERSPSVPININIVQLIHDRKYKST